MMKRNLIRLIVFDLCVWLMMVQPGLSFYWLIDPAVHAAIDAARYGQTIDGRPLPGHVQDHQPPHEHPSSSGVPAPNLSLSNVFDRTFRLIVFAPARRPAINGERHEAAVIADSITLIPLDPPPRA
jgi:hypothetical protein